jgi:hypothetical protein
MSPLLIELEQLGSPLDEEEFTDALNRLYDNCAPPLKDVLLLKTTNTKATNQVDK